MKDDYKIKGPTHKVQIEIEKEVAELLGKMATYTKISESEITNTALRRFIVTHKDFLPADHGHKKK